jgi:anti-sigma B factor antagonist
VSFSVRSAPADGWTVVHVRGEVDIDTAPRLRAALGAAVGRGLPVVLDLGAVTFMDSAGFGLLAATQRQVGAAGTAMRLTRVPPRIVGLLRLLGLDTVLTIEPEAPAEVA